MGKRRTTEEFIEEARQVHGNKYDYSKAEFTSTKNKVCIICPKHGEFWQTPNKHLSRKQGCPKCARERTIEAHRDNLQSFIEKARLIHGNKYDYSKAEYVDSQTKVKIICPTHGEFNQTPNAHLRGQGCPLCGIEHLANSFSKSQQQFIEEAKKIHGDKYDYSKVEYVNSRTKVCIICPKHGEFWQTPSNHLRGEGCMECGKEKVRELRRYDAEQFIELAKIKHNNKYDYSKVEYIGSITKVCIICLEHGEFWQTPSNHLYGEGCPKCKQSLLENKIESLLIKNNIEFIAEYRNRELLNSQTFDFYLPKHNIAIECQGIQHFKPIDFGGKGKEYAIKQFDNLQMLDKRKNLICKQNNIKLLYFTDLDYESFLDSPLIKTETQLLDEINR